MDIPKSQYITALKAKLESYAPIGDQSWQQMVDMLDFRLLKPGEVLLRKGQIARHFYFVAKGALRAFYSDTEGNSYNKNIFLDNDVAASTVSCMQATPSEFTIEALEETVLITFLYQKYRALIDANADMKNYYIAYLEKNWVIEKEQREISLVMENATVRYQKLLIQHPDIDKRIPQLHLASHLGITPTQLSRIRKSLK